MKPAYRFKAAQMWVFPGFLDQGAKRSLVLFREQETRPSGVLAIEGAPAKNPNTIPISSAKQDAADFDSAMANPIEPIRRISADFFQNGREIFNRERMTAYRPYRGFRHRRLAPRDCPSHPTRPCTPDSNRTGWRKNCTVLAMRSLALLVFVFSAAGQNTRKQPALRVLLVEGQGAINIVNKKTDRRLTVRVEEKFAVPAKGIPVTFALPDSGPSGSFGKKGARSVTVNTDDQGYAVARFRSNKIAGQYTIRVSASMPGRPVTIGSIPQTNARGASADLAHWPEKVAGSVAMAAETSGRKIKGLVGHRDELRPEEAVPAQGPPR
jgi:hypothetical protein